MDDQEFRRILDLFPVVRPRNYHIEMDPSRQSTSRSFPEPIELDPSEQSTHLSLPAAFKARQEAEQEEGKKESNNQVIDLQDAFWEKLKMAVEKKAGATEAKTFCKAFQEIHRKLVYEELSLDAACSFINLSKSSGH
ncbi:hypothetical protein OIU76_020314 [Salix suchowensis]|uniref:Uncharacterized protein n=3 Tax=Salix TaxID=40685 RepID=A0A9Q0VUV4_SALPP|nr:Chaperonin [Salix suchowensis]KAJ6424611.1 hypothetical protein OIU84_025398 [Salix udensis]KAJ6755028.1 hypothetical protein OIU79_027613 [Salix purpurea]KAJ6299316.1 hypothetical protein OIU76_020314 [Salix suchowensis]KAJ6302798.1 hypothetical protein OIU77_016818 [Salix suchowensis]